MRFPKFYALIIGTEILNGRREDRHFNFLKDTLKKRDLIFSGSFIIDDTPEIIDSTVSYIANLPNSVLFSFGGIGSTSDDHTRLSVAKALSDGKLYLNKEFTKLIEDRFKGLKVPKYAYNMAMIPKDSKLLPNLINNMAGFSLDDRFFFMPGFPQMSHPMVGYALNKYFNNIGQKEYRYTLIALCKESDFIDLMKTSSKDVEVSSLPKLYSNGARVTISVVSYDKKRAKKEFEKYTYFLDKKGISYNLGEE